MKARDEQCKRGGCCAMRPILFLLLLAWLAAGCTAETDRDVYELNQEAWGIFTNNLPQLPAYLGGCGFFYKEKLVGDEWVDWGPDILCVWEGDAFAVAPSESVEQAFLTDETGTWRLVYGVGLLCSETDPLSPRHCKVLGQLESNEYRVVAPEEPSDEALCEETQGVWVPHSCGHYFCGRPPMCLAIIPGCDCGPSKNFEPGLGCVEDYVCTQERL